MFFGRRIPPNFDLRLFGGWKKSHKYIPTKWWWFTGDESHGRIRKKSPEKQTKHKIATSTIPNNPYFNRVPRLFPVKINIKQTKGSNLLGCPWKLVTS